MTLSCSFSLQAFSNKCSVVSRSLIEILLCLSFQKKNNSEIIHHRHGISAPPHTHCIASPSYILTLHQSIPYLLFSPPQTYLFLILSLSSPTFRTSSSLRFAHWPFPPLHFTTTTLSVLYCVAPTFSLPRTEGGWCGVGWGGVGGALGEAVMFEHGPAVWAAEHLEALRAFWCLTEWAS